MQLKVFPAELVLRSAPNQPQMQALSSIADERNEVSG